MGRIGRLLSFIRVVRNGAKLSDVKVDIGGGEVLTGEHVHPSGEDAFPLPDDQIVAIPVAQTGRIVIIGYVEPDAVQKAQAGEKRIYARNGDRVEVVELWLQADGSATLSNDNGSFELRVDGTINLNGVTIDPSGNVVVPTSLMLAGKEIAGHDHDFTKPLHPDGTDQTGGNN